MSLFSVISRTHIGEKGSYPSAEMQSVYSTALADWAVSRLIMMMIMMLIIDNDDNEENKCVVEKNRGVG